MVTAFRQVIKAEGPGALLTGFGPTAIGYALQGAFKFGGYEFWKKTAIETFGVEKATENRQLIYLGSSAIAEFFADIALCPLEATRIRLVSQPTFASGLLSGFAKIAKNEGFMGFYSGWVICIISLPSFSSPRSFGPILFKQVPYTMAKFAVYEVAFVRTNRFMSACRSFVSRKT
jgi:solute carrier family 25 (mitochondrial phosphate transporter), member 3